jgi:hypothetical protein
LIFVEMEESGHTLSEEEFVDATFRLYESLPIYSKRTLFDAKEVNSAMQQAKRRGTHHQHHMYKP